MDVVFRIIGCIVVVASAFCIYMAIAEMILLHERRLESGIDIELAISNSKNYATDYIISLMQKNDIIEFLIVSNNKIIKLGASSNSHNGSSKFFDKRYYISDQENITIEVLSEVINKYSIDGKICVIKIDGMSPNDFEGS